MHEGEQPFSVAFLSNITVRQKKFGVRAVTIDGDYIMGNQHDAQIKALDKKINDLKKLLASLGQGEQLDALLAVIHKPGWTTLREVAISAALLDSMSAHTQALVKTHAALLRAAKAASAGE
jgi:hypothetical protein